MSQDKTYNPASNWMTFSCKTLTDVHQWTCNSCTDSHMDCQPCLDTEGFDFSCTRGQSLGHVCSFLQYEYFLLAYSCWIDSVGRTPSCPQLLGKSAVFSVKIHVIHNLIKDLFYHSQLIQCQLTTSQNHTYWCLEPSFGWCINKLRLHTLQICMS